MSSWHRSRVCPSSLLDLLPLQGRYNRNYLALLRNAGEPININRPNESRSPLGFFTHLSILIVSSSRYGGSMVLMREFAPCLSQRLNFRRIYESSILYTIFGLFFLRGLCAMVVLVRFRGALLHVFDIRCHNLVLAIFAIAQKKIFLSVKEREQHLIETKSLVLIVWKEQWEPLQAVRSLFWPSF